MVFDEGSGTDEGSLPSEPVPRSGRRAGLAAVAVLACVGLSAALFFFFSGHSGGGGRGGSNAEQFAGGNAVSLFGLWKPKQNKLLGWKARQVRLPQAMGQDLCNHKVELPEDHEPQKWNLSEATSKLCYRMFQDQTGLTAGHPWGRDWCWVAMKRYGCLYNLGDRFTWAEAQEAAHKAAPPLPSRDESPMRPLQDEHICDGRDFGKVPEWQKSDWEKARAWFRSNVAVYVLNLPSEKERWHNVSGHLRGLDILPNRVPGYDLRREADLRRAYRDGAIPPQFNISHAQEAAKSPENGMGGIRGTVGCAAAHFHAQRLATRVFQAKPITLILEDDVYLSDDFIPRVWSLVQTELPCDWEAVSLGSRCPYGKCISRHLSRVWPDVNEPEWRCRHGTNYGFQGVLYRTKSIAGLQEKWKRVVFDEKRPHCLDVDVALASIADQVGFYAVPSAQFPGFLIEKQEKSVREKINNEGGDFDSNMVNSLTFRGGLLPRMMQ
jgi:hypothetical protein